jgi:hypothetical protein
MIVIRLGISWYNMKRFKYYYNLDIIKQELLPRKTTNKIRKELLSF